MSAAAIRDARSAALDAFLKERQANGFSIETWTAVQAILVRPPRLYSVKRLFGQNRDRSRFVVSVDEHGVVTSVRAEPRRW